MKAYQVAAAFASTLLFASAATNAAITDLGIAIGGKCVAGTCANQTANLDASESLSFSREIELSDGDLFGVAVQLARTLEPITGHRYIKVEYLGRVVDGSVVKEASQSDTLTIDALRAWQSPTGRFTTDMAGSLSAGLASGSSLSIAIGDLSAHKEVANFGTFDAAGPFSKTLNYQLSVSQGLALSDTRNVFSFAKGSEAGSFITIGSPVPEPGSLALMALGIPMLLMARRHARIA